MVVGAEGVTKIVIACGLLVLVSAAACDAWKKKVTLEPFAAPKEFEEKHYTGASITADVADRLNEWFEHRSKTSRRHAAVQRTGSRTEAEIPETHFSLQSVTSLLAYVLNREPLLVTGDIIPRDDHSSALSLHVGRSSSLPLQIPVPPDRETLIQEVALTILNVTEPNTAADVLVAKFRDKDALRVLERATSDESASRGERAQSSLRIGWLKQDKRELSEAAGAFDGAIELDPWTVDGYLGKSATRIDQHNLREAMQAVNECLSLIVGMPFRTSLREELAATLSQRAEVLHAGWDLTTAAFWARLALNLDSLDRRFETLGYVLMDDERQPEARRTFGDCTNVFPESSRCHAGLGFVDLYDGNPSSALSEFEYAKSPDERNVWPYIGLSRAHSALGEFEKAQQALTEVDQFRQNDPDVLNELGMLLMRYEHYQQAEEELRKAVAIDPLNVDAHINLAILLSWLNRNEESHSAFARAREVSEQRWRRVPSPFLFVEEGRDAVSELRIADADTALSEARRISRGEVEIPILAAQIDRAKWKLDEAMSEIAAAIKRNPGSSDAYAERAMIQRLRGVEAEVVGNDAEAALARDSGNFVPLVTAGDAQLDSRSCATAEDYYFKALKIAPANEEALIALGRIYRIAGRFKDSERALRAAVVTDSRSSTARVELGNLGRGNPTLSWNGGTARAMYESAREFQPRDSTAWLEDAELARQERDFDRAEALLRESRALDPRDPLLFVYEAALQISRGDTSGAATTLGMLNKRKNTSTRTMYASPDSQKTLATIGSSISLAGCKDPLALRGFDKHP